MAVTIRERDRKASSDMNIVACSIEECERLATNAGMCPMHRKRFLKHGSTDARPRKSMAGQECAAEGCDTPLSPPYGRGLCSLHYGRLQKYGSTELPPRAMLKNTPCTVRDCEKPHASGGMCSAHYTRLRRTGSATTRKFGQVVDGKRICATCNVDTPLELMSKSAKSYCRECVNTAARARLVYKPKVLGKRPCNYCGLEFSYNKKKNLHCSPECAAATINTRNWKHLQARRARMKDAYVESFHSREIYERDRWLCGICEKQIDPAAKLPDKMSASIDHVIPISKGGTHERANVQAAHLFCNVSKGAKLAS